MSLTASISYITAIPWNQAIFPSTVLYMLIHEFPFHGVVGNYRPPHQQKAAAHSGSSCSKYPTKRVLNSYLTDTKQLSTSTTVSLWGTCWGFDRRDEAYWWYDSPLLLTVPVSTPNTTSSRPFMGHPRSKTAYQAGAGKVGLLWRETLTFSISSSRLSSSHSPASTATLFQSCRTSDFICSKNLSLGYSVTAKGLA